MDEVKLEMTVLEVNTVLKALGQFPYNQVNELITKIHQQASTQIGQQNGQSTNGQEKKEVAN